jgi:hypothetical protein
MSQMLAGLGMPRNGQKTFHSLRHNANDALARVPAAVLPNADVNLRKFIRYTLMGHQIGQDVNARHYTSTSMSERSAMLSALNYRLPPIAKLDVDFAICQIRTALGNKAGDRRGREDMGPLSEPTA